MNLHDILLPVFAQVALVFGLLLLTGYRRFGAVRSGTVEASAVSLGERAWPASAQQAANAFANQFEVPVLYLVLVPLAILTLKADTLFVLLSWIFVVSRYAQAGIYVTTNYVPFRFAAFLVGVCAVVAMWIVFAVRILSIPLPA